jgi:hypothetical protein
LLFTNGILFVFANDTQVKSLGITKDNDMPQAKLPRKKMLLFAILWFVVSLFALIASIISMNNSSQVQARDSIELQKLTAQEAVSKKTQSPEELEALKTETYRPFRIETPDSLIGFEQNTVVLLLMAFISLVIGLLMFAKRK